MTQSTEIDANAMSQGWPDPQLDYSKSSLASIPSESTATFVNTLDPLDTELSEINQTIDTAVSEGQLAALRNAEIEEQVKALQAQIKALYDAQRPNNDIIRLSNLTARRAKDKRYEIEQAIKVREENERHARELAAKRETLEIDSQTFKWRTGTSDGLRAFRHQIDGAFFLAEAGRGAILADSMGLGKTGTSLFGCDLAGAKRILIVCPGEIMSGFAKEINRWTDRMAFVLGKQPKSQVRMIFQMRKGAGVTEFVDIINYEAWARDKNLLIELESMQYDTIIVDEAHNIKETDTSAFKGIKQIAFSRNRCDQCGSFGRGHCFKPACGGTLVASAERVYCMTGTPILNQPSELFALLHLINPEHFFSKASFQRQYCTWDYEKNKYVFRPGGEASLAERLSGMYLRRTHKSAGIVLPKQDIIYHDIELDSEAYPKQDEILKTLAEHAAIEIEEGRASNMMSVLALITRQRQAATWPGGIVLHEPVLDEETGEPLYDDNAKPIVNHIPVGLNYQESVKIDRAMELINEFVSDEQRIVVFSQFRETLAELKRRCDLAGVRAAEFHGGTPDRERADIKNNFDRSVGEEPRWDIVLCHYRTGGVGLNLTAATATIIMDEEWNPGKNKQAYDRTNRLGQTEETSVHILRLADSIDAWMADLNDSKLELIGRFDTANEDAKKELVDIFRRAAA